MNNKRWPVLASFLLFLVLCASLAYWALQLFQPPPRPVAAPPRAAAPQIDGQAAAALFGGQGGTATASNFQLRGVIYAGTPEDSVAILAVDGEPARAVRAGAEVVPGVTVREVHRAYVLLSENGTNKRVDLPEDIPPSSGRAAGIGPAPVPIRPAVPVPSPAGPRPPPAAANAPPPANGAADAAGRVQRGFVAPEAQQGAGQPTDQAGQAQIQQQAPAQGQVQLPPEAPPSTTVVPDGSGAVQPAPQNPAQAVPQGG